MLVRAFGRKPDLVVGRLALRVLILESVIGGERWVLRFGYAVCVGEGESPGG